MPQSTSTVNAKTKVWPFGNLREDKERRMAWYFLAPTMIILIGITIWPLIYALFISFTNYSLALTFMGHQFVGLQNYASLFTSSSFWNAARNTLLFAVIGIGVEFLLGLGLAVVATQNLRFMTPFRVILILPVIVTPVIMGLTWRLMFNEVSGVLNYILHGMGLPAMNWLSSPQIALYSLIMVDIWQWTPFMFLLLVTGITAIPQEIDRALLVDGIPPFMKFWRVTLPLLKPVILIAVLIRLMDVLKYFDTIFIMTGGGPGNVTETLSFYSYKQGFVRFESGYAAAVAIIILFTIVLCSTRLVSSMRESKTE